MSNIRNHETITEKKRNRWDSDDEGDIQRTAYDNSQISTNAWSSSKCEYHQNECSEVVNYSRTNKRLESPQQVGVATMMDQQKAAAAWESNCYPYSPLLQGCRYELDCYERLDVIAEGTYGIVWKAKDKHSQEIVALKQIKDVSTKEGFPLLALREMQALLDLSHDCIVSIREVVVGYKDLDKVFMVFPYLDMDLRDAMEQDQDSPFSQAQMKRMLHQILSAMEYVHDCWYLHRDVKPSNFLVSGEKLKLCDFGLARKYHDPLKAYTQPVITLWYRPPELLFGETVYGPEVDMWSVGCLFAELLIKGEVLFPGEGELGQIHEIFDLLGSPTEDTWPGFRKLPIATLFHWKSSSRNQSRDLLRDRFTINSFGKKQTFLDENGFDLLSSMLTLNPKKRITAGEALKHLYFTQGVTIKKEKK